MEVCEARSRWMNETAMEGLMVLIWVITGVILKGSRPRRRIVDGEEWERERAVSAPIEERLGPVMMTWGC